MSRLTLILREPPTQRVDLSPLTAAPLGNRSVAEIAAIELPTGNRKVRVDSLFKLSGDPGEELEIVGNGLLDRIGAGMTQGLVVVRGDTGAFLGIGMTGGMVEVEGNTGAYAGTGMKGGTIRICGNAGDFLAAAIPGNHQGMLGGTLLVRGNAGDRAGDRMRRGALLIEGNAGDYCASRMVAGTIAVWGKVGRSPGLAMRRGTVLLFDPPAALPPTFNDCGAHPFNFLTLLARSWRVHPGKFATLTNSGLRLRRFMGDLANDGRGEILMKV
jgi:formylmethanofuran dehydrogenase subunit C